MKMRGKLNIANTLGTFGNILNLPVQHILNILLCPNRDPIAKVARLKKSINSNTFPGQGLLLLTWKSLTNGFLTPRGLTASCFSDLKKRTVITVSHTTYNHGGNSAHRYLMPKLSKSSICSSLIISARTIRNSGLVNLHIPLGQLLSVFYCVIAVQNSWGWNPPGQYFCTPLQVLKSFLPFFYYCYYPASPRLDESV